LVEVSRIPVNREHVLLETVNRSGGAWSTRNIDFEVSRRASPGDLTVLDELKVLEARGLVRHVQRADNPKFTGWALSSQGHDRLAELTTSLG
jgi:hypothetical protein